MEVSYTSVLSIVFAIVFVGLVVFMIYRAVRFGGWKGVLFGPSLVETVGRVEAEKTGMKSCEIGVHRLRDEQVGLSLLRRSALSVEAVPITLTNEQARRLSEYLALAVRKR